MRERNSWCCVVLLDAKFHLFYLEKSACGHKYAAEFVKNLFFSLKIMEIVKIVLVLHLVSSEIVKSIFLEGLAHAVDALNISQMEDLAHLLLIEQEEILNKQPDVSFFCLFFLIFHRFHSLFFFLGRPFR